MLLKALLSAKESTSTDDTISNAKKNTKKAFEKCPIDSNESRYDLFKAHGTTHVLAARSISNPFLLALSLPTSLEKKKRSKE